MSDITITRRMSVQAADRALLDTWNGGKNRESGTPLADHVRLAKEDPSGYADAYIPLAWVRPNEAGDVYDEAVNLPRVQRYAQANISTPVHLLFSERMMARGKEHAYVSDGGHRVSAARMRGDTHILALMPSSDLDRLTRLHEFVLQIEDEPEPDSGRHHVDSSLSL